MVILSGDEQRAIEEVRKMVKRKLFLAQTSLAHSKGTNRHRVDNLKLQISVLDKLIANTL